jgi:hypothetical protein
MLKEDLSQWTEPRLRKEIERRQRLLDDGAGRFYRSVIADEIFQIKKALDQKKRKANDNQNASLNQEVA